MSKTHDQNWYSSDDLPLGRLHIRAWWHIHGVPEIITVARDWDRRRAEWQWFLVAHGSELMAIPPKGADGKAWGEMPFCWQPLDVSRWTWPGDEPAPLPVHAIPRAEGGSRLRFESVAGAENGDGEDGEASIYASEMLWWRDATAIRYEPAGEVTRRMAEGRVMRALAHCGAIAPKLRDFTTGTLLARLVDERERYQREMDEARVAAVRLARFQPLPRDHDDFLTAMAWFAAIAPPDLHRKAWRLTRVQRAMHLRSMDKALSFAAIGYAISSPKQRARRPISYQRAQQIYESGIDMAWAAANRQVLPQARVA